MRLNVVNAISQLKWAGAIVIILLILFTGIFSWINNRNEKKSQSIGDMMYDALIGEISNDEMIKILDDVAKIGGSNYQYLAKFKLASIYAENQIEKAQLIYSDLAADKKLTPELRELAEYLEIITLLKGDDNVDLLKDKIRQFLSKKVQVYKSSIKEVIAVSMLKNNDVNSAIGIIKEIMSDANADPLVYKNAINLLQIYEN